MSTTAKFPLLYPPPLQDPHPLHTIYRHICGNVNSDTATLLHTTLVPFARLSETPKSTGSLRIYDPCVDLGYLLTRRVEFSLGQQPPLRRASLRWRRVIQLRCRGRPVICCRLVVRVSLALDISRSRSSQENSETTRRHGRMISHSSRFGYPHS